MPMVLGGGRQLPIGKKTALGKGGQERRGRRRERTVGVEWSVWTGQSTESMALILLITIKPLISTSILTLE